TGPPGGLPRPTSTHGFNARVGKKFSLLPIRTGRNPAGLLVTLSFEPLSPRPAGSPRGSGAGTAGWSGGRSGPQWRRAWGPTLEAQPLSETYADSCTARPVLRGRPAGCPRARGAAASSGPRRL